MKRQFQVILHDGSGEDKNNDFDDDDDDNGDESGDDDDDAGRENSGFQTAEFQENDHDIRAAEHTNALLSTATHYKQLQPTIHFQCKDLLSTASNYPL